MKSIYKANLHYSLSAGVTILTLFVALAPSAAAKHRPVKPSVEPLTVIGHVALPDTPVSEMFLHDRGDKHYLLIGDNSEQHFTVVDITEPNEPNIIETTAPPQDSSNGKLETVGGGLPLTKAPAKDSRAAAGRTSNQLASILDLIEAANPQKIQGFSEINSILSDDRRNLIYVTNSEGLWVLMLEPELPAASKRHGCSTEDAFDEIAHCQ
jgi:hypothetical protein